MPERPLPQDSAVGAFAPILGTPCWNVRRGHGSFVTIEFGDPAVVFGEPRRRSVRVGGVDREMSTRSAVIRGSWHLWIYCCEWTLAVNGDVIADSESDDETIAQALSVLDGQALAVVDIERGIGESQFGFDLGASLATRPASGSDGTDGSVEQWMLYQPSGDVITFLSDGRFVLELGAGSE